MSHFAPPARFFPPKCRGAPLALQALRVAQATTPVPLQLIFHPVPILHSHHTYSVGNVFVNETVTLRYLQMIKGRKQWEPRGVGRVANLFKIWTCSSCSKHIFPFPVYMGQKLVNNFNFNFANFFLVQAVSPTHARSFGASINWSYDKRDVPVRCVYPNH